MLWIDESEAMHFTQAALGVAQQTPAAV